MLNDETQINESAKESPQGVKGHFNVAGQYQIIFGSGIVNQVYAEMAKLTGLVEMSTNDLASAGAEKQNWAQRAVKGLSDILSLSSRDRGKWFIDGTVQRIDCPGLFIEDQSLIDANPGLADLASMINTFANAPLSIYPYCWLFCLAQVCLQPFWALRWVC